MKMNPVNQQVELLQAMLSINKLILHEDDSGILMQKVCELLSDLTGALCSLIVEFDRDGHYFRAFNAQFNADYLPLVPYLEDGGELKCAKLAIETNSVVVIDNTQIIPGKNVKNSTVTFPIFFQEKNFGFITVFTAAPSIYCENNLKIFFEIGECLGFSQLRLNFEAKLKKVIKALEESTERLKEAQSLALVGSWELDIETHVLHWSDEVYQIFDCTPQEFGATHEAFMSFMHPDDRDSFEKAYFTSLETQKPFEVEHRLITKRGKIKYVKEKCNSFFDAAGKPLTSRGVVIDISSIKEADKALVEAKNRAEYYLDIAGSLIIAFDRNGIITLINQTGLEILGYSREELLGENWFDICIPETMRKTIKQVFSKVVVGDIKSVKRYVNEVITKTGELKTISWNNSSISDENGDFLYLLSSGNDITEIIQTQNELQQSKDRFEQAMLATQDGLWDWDLATNEIYYSPGWKSMLGYEYDEIPNDFAIWETATDPEDVKRSWEMQQELIAKKRDRFELEFMMKHKDGHWVDILSRATAIFDDSGKAVRIVGTHVDISSRKLAEKRHLELQERLTQVQKMESIGRLAGGVAHDFNNMLSVILGQSEMALNDLQDGNPLYNCLDEIRKAAQRSADLTNQLLTFARRQTVTPRSLDLNETIEKILNMLNILIGENIDLRWNPAEILLPVKIDPTQIDQLLTNLVVNARDAIGSIGTIIIETGNTHVTAEYVASHAEFIPGRYNTLAVSDNGHGMDEKTKEYIFEPFFTTRRVGEGTGLGLATVYGIVKQNKGFISVYSELGIGTTFKVYLPAYESAETAQNRVNSVEDLKIDGHETILLVEDESAILELGKMILESFGYRVLAAATPGEAIQKGAEHKGEIELLITDVVMPEMNGRDLAKQLISLYPGIKCLFMSGYTTDIIAHNGILDEAVNFLQKPFSIKELGTKVREVLEKD
jgi:PAS domain S-box-containing protein